MADGGCARHCGAKRKRAGAASLRTWADCAAKADPALGLGYSAAVRARNICIFFGLCFALATAAWPADARAADAPDQGLLRGPHPFLKENALVIAGGYSAATGGMMGGFKVKGAYEYELVGSLWLNLQINFVNGSDQPLDRRPCASCGSAADAMAGLSYRLRMDVPIILAGTLAGGFLFVFPDQFTSAMGLGVRPSISARYYLYDWFGMGVELGGLLGFASHDAASGLSRGLASLEALVGVEIQFDTP